MEAAHTALTCTYHCIGLHPQQELGPSGHTHCTTLSYTLDGGLPLPATYTANTCTLSLQGLQPQWLPCGIKAGLLVKGL